MAIGIKAGDEVILPDFTFFATAGTVARLNAVPVFTDIDLKTFNISPEAVKANITPKTKAIIPVHLYGRCANMSELKKISEEYNIPLIEDACQAIGSYTSDGYRAGSVGSLACFSFYPTKNLGGAGDAGAITTDNKELYEKLKQMRNHGMEPRYYHSFIGGNFRMDELQAAFLLKKIPFLQNWNKARRATAELYRDLFDSVGLFHKGAADLSDTVNIILPEADFHKHIACSTNNNTNTNTNTTNNNKLNLNNYHTFHQYVIRCKKRDELKTFLAEKQIGTDIYYPVPLHKQKCFEYLNHDDAKLKNTNKICDEVLALPIFPELKVEQVKYVVQQISEFYKTQTD